MPRSAERGIKNRIIRVQRRSDFHASGFRILSQPLVLLHFCVFVEDFLHGIRLLLDALLVVPGANDEEDGCDAYEDEARRVGIFKYGIVPDDRLDGG